MLQEIGKNHPIDIEKLKKEIIDRLRPLDPYKVILFGSYAYGNPTKDSDIDLYVVTNDEFMPKSWREKMQIKLQYAKALSDLRERLDIDLIVHTRKMHQKFLEYDSIFSKDITSKGQVIYECEK